MLITAPITPLAGTRVALILQLLGWAIAAVSAIGAVARKARESTPQLTSVSGTTRKYRPRDAVTATGRPCRELRCPR